MKPRRHVIQKTLGILQMVYALFVILFGGTILYGQLFGANSRSPDALAAALSIVMVAAGVALMIIGDRISGSILGENDENNYGTYKEIIIVALNLVFALASALCFGLCADVTFKWLYVLAYIPILPLVALAATSVVLKRSDG